MTANKRFTIQDERTIKDNQKYVTENGYVFSYKSDAEEVCALLNSLNEENEKLKMDNQNWYLQDSKIRVELHNLKEENQRLKKQIHELITGIQETSKLSAEAITKQYAEDKYL